MRLGAGPADPRDDFTIRLLLSMRRWRFYWRITMALVRAGERLGADWLVYNPLIFAYYHEMALESAPVVAAALERAEAQTYADIGAGTAAFSAELQRRGRKAIAYERSRLARLLARRQE